LAVADVSQPWYARLTKAVERLLDERNYHLQLFDINHSLDKLVECLDELPKWSVDGAILSTGDDLSSARVLDSLEHLAARFPVVVAGQRLDHAGVPSVVYDDRGGAYAATEHLVNEYGELVAYVGLIPGSLLASERFAGYEAALARAGLSPLAVDVLGFDSRAGFEAMQRLLADVRPRAVLAANDELAVGAIRALSEAKLAVPRDVGIVGFGDTSFARYLTPSLSSVWANAAEIASVVVGNLFSVLDGGTPKLLRTVPRELVVRESSVRTRAAQRATRRPASGASGAVWEDLDAPASRK
jgi:DNA-binding LacI/PurR family transcriptional regulator